MLAVRSLVSNVRFIILVLHLGICECNLVRYSLLSLARPTFNNFRLFLSPRQPLIILTAAHSRQVSSITMLPSCFVTLCTLKTTGFLL